MKRKFAKVRHPSTGITVYVKLSNERIIEEGDYYIHFVHSHTVIDYLGRGWYLNRHEGTKVDKLTMLCSPKPVKVVACSVRLENLPKLRWYETLKAFLTL